MLIIPVKEGEAIERALKRFKRKFDKTGVMKQLRARQQFNKPSVVKRKEHAKAVYVQSLREKENEQFKRDKLKKPRLQGGAFLFTIVSGF